MNPGDITFILVMYIWSFSGVACLSLLNKFPACNSNLSLSVPTPFRFNCVKLYRMLSNCCFTVIQRLFFGLCVCAVTARRPIWKDCCITESNNQAFSEGIPGWLSDYLLKCLSSCTPPPPPPTHTHLPPHRSEPCGPGSSRDNQPPSITDADERSTAPWSSLACWTSHGIEQKPPNANHLQWIAKWKELSFQERSIVACFSKPCARVCSLMMKVRKEAVSRGDCTLLGKVVTMTLSNNRLMRMLQRALWRSLRCRGRCHSAILIEMLIPLLCILPDWWSWLGGSLLMKRRTCGEPLKLVF